jgi:hypothetical protein
LAVDIETEFAGEFDAISGDVERMKSESVAEKESELLQIKQQLTEAEQKLEEARDEGRKDGAAQAIAIVKRRLGIF